jgi:hypothetical protein
MIIRTTDRTRPEPSEQSTSWIGVEETNYKFPTLQTFITVWAVAHIFCDLVSFIHWCVDHFKFVP